MEKKQTINESELYYEIDFNNKHCYKFDLPGERIIIVSDTDKNTALEMMRIELKELHNITLFP